MDLEFSVVDVVNFYKCHPVVPLVEGHVFGVQLAKTTHAPSRGHISVEVAFVVFACLVVVTAHCGGLRAHVQTAGGVNRRRRTTASKLVAVNKVQASRLGHTFPVNEFTPQSLEAEKVFESPLVHQKETRSIEWVSFLNYDNLIIIQLIVCKIYEHPNSLVLEISCHLSFYKGLRHKH